MSVADGYDDPCSLVRAYALESDIWGTCLLGLFGTSQLFCACLTDTKDRGRAAWWKSMSTTQRGLQDCNPRSDSTGLLNLPANFLASSQIVKSALFR